MARSTSPSGPSALLAEPGHPYRHRCGDERVPMRARTLVSDGTLGYDQKIRRLATLATEALPYPGLSEACREALDERVICDLYEGNAPFAPRYVLPDYGRAMHRGIEFLELSPPTDLDDALAFLQIMYAHVPSVTTYPVYLGDLDELLGPFVDERIDDERARPHAAPVLDRPRPDAARRVRAPRRRSPRQPRSRARSCVSSGRFGSRCRTSHSKSTRRSPPTT